MQKKRPTAQQDTWVTGDTRAWWLDIDGYCSSLPRTSPLARMIDFISKQTLHDYCSPRQGLL